MTTLSLKVPVSLLIENAETQRAKIVAAHATKVTAHRNTSGVAKRELIAKVRQTATELRSGERKATAGSTYRNGKYVDTLSITVSVDYTKKPDDKPDTSRIDRDLRLLRVTSEDSIRVRVDSDLARYL